MASTVIKGGTIVTADLTYKSDVKIQGGKIVAIGDGLEADKVLDAHRLFHHARRHRSTYPSGNAVHGYILVGRF